MTLANMNLVVRVKATRLRRSEFGYGAIESEKISIATISY